jgi:hypothetical protein
MPLSTQVTPFVFLSSGKYRFELVWSTTPLNTRQAHVRHWLRWQIAGSTIPLRAAAWLCPFRLRIVKSAILAIRSLARLAATEVP